MNFPDSDNIILPGWDFVKKKCGRVAAAYRDPLLFAEGHAVGALILGGVSLVGAHTDLVQRAVVLIFAVVCAGAHGAFDGLVGMAVHS